MKKMSINFKIIQCMFFLDMQINTTCAFGMIPMSDPRGRFAQPVAASVYFGGHSSN